MADERRKDLALQMVTNLPQWGTWAVNIRDFATPYGKVGFRQLAILWALRYDLVPADDLSPTALARQQNVRPSVITRALARLEDGGFIERTMDLDDRRRIHVTITEKGRDLSIYVEQMYLREIMDSMANLDDVEIDSLRQAVEQLSTIIADLKEKRRQAASPVVAAVER